MVKSSSVHQSEKKLINSLMDTHTKIVPPVKSFELKSSTEFTERSLSIFNKLNAIEMNHETWILENGSHDSFDPNNNEPPPVTFGVFRKPLRPVPQKRKGRFFPYETKMKKWIKYSLEDVKVSSDANNTAIALQFLDELRKKKKSIDEVTSSDDKVMFRKPMKRFLKANDQSVSTSASNNDLWKHHSRFEKNCAKEMRLASDIKLLHLHDDADDSF